MYKLLLCVVLFLPTSSFADSCADLSAQADTFAHDLRKLHEDITKITLQISKMEELEHMDYDRYIDFNLKRHELERDLIDKENFSFFVEIRRIRECGLPVTYKPKKRNKKA